MRRAPPPVVHLHDVAVRERGEDLHLPLQLAALCVRHRSKVDELHDALAVALETCRGVGNLNSAAHHRARAAANDFAECKVVKSPTSFHSQFQCFACCGAMLCLLWRDALLRCSRRCGARLRACMRLWRRWRRALSSLQKHSSNDGDDGDRRSNDRFQVAACI